jgi:hypothetical protein
VINLNVLSSLGNNRDLAGMAVYGGGTNSRVFWTNAGQINVNSTSNNASATVSAGFIRGRSQADVVNTGTLTVSELSGNTELSGLEVFMQGGSTVPASATLTNSGTILVSSPTASFASGVEMRQVAANNSNNPHPEHSTITAEADSCGNADNITGTYTGRSRYHQSLEG